MKRIQVEFIPFRRRSMWPWAAVAGGCLLLAVHQGWLAFAAFREGETLRTAAAIATDTPTTPQSTAAVESLPYARDAQNISRIAAFDTPGVLAAIESAQVPGVRVSAILIRAEEAEVRLEIEVRSASDALDYLQAINAGMPEQGRWRLVRSQAGRDGGAGSATLALVLPPSK